MSLIDDAKAYFAPDATVTLCGKPAPVTERALTRSKKLLRAALTSAMIGGAAMAPQAAHAMSFGQNLAQIARNTLSSGATGYVSRQTWSLVNDVPSVTKKLFEGRTKATLDPGSWRVMVVSDAAPVHVWVANRNGRVRTDGQQFDVQRGDAIVFFRGGPRHLSREQFKQDFVPTKNEWDGQSGLYGYRDKMVLAEKMEKPFEANNGSTGNRGDYLIQYPNGAQVAVSASQFESDFMQYNKQDWQPQVAQHAAYTSDVQYER